mmetsp:Transcript_17165/g.51539  ORF Transcript_17165/g.51539 Transcript_17165/m.51539 type:complete len:82 (-) Transcript_17165:767-1012(-)
MCNFNTQAVRMGGQHSHQHFEFTSALTIPMIQIKQASGIKRQLQHAASALLLCTCPLPTHTHTRNSAHGTKLALLPSLTAA